jgi:glycosyltransferase involved in cell wall biosynthesis
MKDVVCLHYPHYHCPFSYRGPLVVTIHDLNHFLFPQYLPSHLHHILATRILKHSINRASRIITGSEYIKGELVKYLRVEAEKVEVIPHAVSEALKPCEDEERLALFRQEYQLPAEYLLTVGINKPHKNYAFLLRVLAECWNSKAIELPLVFCGISERGRANLIAVIESLGIGSSVIFMPYVDYQDLALVYAGAVALVFPSLYEGFGLPLLEAMKMGVPVAASKLPPLPEVAGDAAVWFDPTDEADAGSAIQRVVGDEKLRGSLISQGRERVQAFSWEKSARATLEIYRRIHDTCGVQ